MRHSHHHRASLRSDRHGDRDHRGRPDFGDGRPPRGHADDRHFTPFDHHQRGRRGGRGHGGRFFENGELRLLILELISTQPRHGYELIRLIEEQLGGAHTPSPGIVYPTLTMLEEEGWASVTSEGTRKLYQATEEGLRELSSSRAAVDAVKQRLQVVSQRVREDRPSSILRAMENLKMVLRSRADRLSPEQVLEVTDLIDDTAKRIERLS